MIAEGKIWTPRKRITHEVALENVMEGYRIFENKEEGVIKVAVKAVKMLRYGCDGGS